MRKPFTYFGGKTKISKIIWEKFGSIENYIEPFAGSLAVLLDAPYIPKLETINDIDCYVSNFWRATSKEPEKVAKYADYPVNEADYHAKNNFLISNIKDFTKKMHTDPDFYDCKLAGEWVWVVSLSIGNNYCNTKGLKAIPLLSAAGGGIKKINYDVYNEFEILKNRLKNTRVACGDWKRIITPGITFKNKGLTKNGITGIFLDPPYDLKNRDKVYSNESNVFNEVFEWAILNGNNPKLRIALCGYDDNRELPKGWVTHCWKAGGGYGNLSNMQGRENSHKEIIYFSPYCI